ncbi:hypothetical protein GSQ51_17905 [Clostridioides difficile]|nr:hypothetical protein [Clostridioides difficile]NJK15963.1 hypothetical protein [Clostridioides difficile]
MDDKIKSKEELEREIHKEIKSVKNNLIAIRKYINSIDNKIEIYESILKINENSSPDNRNRKMKTFEIDIIENAFENRECICIDIFGNIYPGRECSNELYCVIKSKDYKHVSLMLHEIRICLKRLLKKNK